MPTGSFSPGQLPAALSRGPLAIRGDVHMIAGTNIAKLAAGAGGAQGWDDTLGVDPHSGAHDAFVDTGRFLSFGTAAPGQTTGHIRAEGNLFIHPDTGFEVQAHDTITIHGPDTILIECTGGSPIRLLTSATVELESTAGPVELNANTFVDLTNGFMRFQEQAASTPSMAAGKALFWVRNDTPNIPMFTNDVNVDFKLLMEGAALGDLQDINTARILGRVTAGSGDVEQLTGTQATTLLDIFTSALKGVVPASGGGTANFLRADGTWTTPTYNTIRVDGVAQTQRGFVNYIDTGDIVVTPTDDAGGNETELRWTFAPVGANTFAANATAGSAAYTPVSVSAESIVARTSGNLGQLTSSVQSALIRGAGSMFFATAAADQVLRRSGSGDLGFGTLVTNNIGNSQITLAKIQNVADDTMLVNISGASGPLAERTLAQMAGDGLSYDATNHHWDVNGSTSIVVTGDLVTRAGLTGFITAAANSNDTRHAGFQLSGSTLPSRMFFDFLMSGGIDITPVDDSVNDRLRLGWSRQALTGAISAASGGNATLFAGIRVNDGLTTDRQNLNFFQSTTIDPAATDDSVNNEIELRFNIITNSVGNTLLSDMPDATIKGRQRGAGTGDPDNLTGSEVGSILRFTATEAINSTGVVSGVNIASTTNVPRWSNGGNTGIILSITAPTSEGQILYPEITTGGGDEAIFVEDTTQAAGSQIRTPGGIPYRLSQSSYLHPMMYQSQGNTWGISGPPGGDHGALLEIDEHFDWAVSSGALLEGGNGTMLFNFTSSNHSWCATATGTGNSATVKNIDNVLHHRGIMELTTTNQSGGDVAIFLARDVITGVAVADDMYDSDQIWRYEAWVRIPSGQTTSFKVLVGFFDDIQDTDGGAEFIGFVGATNNGTSATNWVARCRAASTNTELNTAVAFSNNVWHKLEWFRFDEFVLFYVNRVFVGSISTNVPNGNGDIGVRVESLTAAARVLHVDRIRMHLREAAYD